MIYYFLILLLLCWHPVQAMQDITTVDHLTASIRSSAAAMQAQNERLKVIAQNIANAEVTGVNSGSLPYRRKVLQFANIYDPKKGTTVVKVDHIGYDMSDFVLKYKPDHPASDRRGYVKFPNVDVTIEVVDAKEAQRSFEANINALEIAKTNQSRLLDLMR